jgi:clathrin heavy chain
MLSKDFANAAKIARDAPGTLIRNKDTIEKFKAMQSTGGPPPILVYFSTLLETSQLNELESVELCGPVLKQGKFNLIEDWIKQNKLSITPELNNMIRQHNPKMAASMMLSSDQPESVVQGMIETGQFAQIVPYCQQKNYSPDFARIL